MSVKLAKCLHGHNGDDGQPHHNSGDESHENDPQERYEHGSHQSDENEPPAVVEILKDPFAHLNSM